MPKAARVKDTIAHTSQFAGMLTGLALGVVVGAVAIATGGAGLVFLCAAAATGAKAGGLLGKLFTSNQGVIIKGAKTVRIGRREAARAVDDKVDCHPDQPIAQGSRTVVIEDFPASRIGDKTVCDGTISSGSANVEIGMEPGTYAKIGSEIPLWLQFAVEALSVVGSFSPKGKKPKKPKKPKSKKPRRPKKPKSKGRNKKSNKPKKPRNKKSPKAKKRAPKKRSTPKKKRSAPRKRKGPKTSKKPGKTSKAKRKNKASAGDPVDVASGAVIDSSTDISLPGVIPVRWTRHYDSALETVDGPLGTGGWTHDLDQWITEDDGLIVLRTEEGRDVYFAAVSNGESTFHRGERLTLTAVADGVYRVLDHGSRLTRVYEPFDGSARALLRSIEDVHGNSVRLLYRGEVLERIVDSAGREVRVSVDPRGRITRLEVVARGERVQIVEYEYHPDGELSAVIDALGHSERFEYDEQHCLIQKTLPNGLSFYYEYDEEDGRCIAAWGDGGLHARELEYDEDEQTTLVFGDHESRFYEWNDDGAVFREATYEGEELRVVDYDDDGLVVEEGKTSAAVTSREYDENGDLVAETDPGGNTTRWEFSNGLPARKIDPDGHVTTFAHDARALLVEVILPTGLRRSFSHDLHGRLTAIREGDRLVSRFEHDAEHNVVREWDERGALWRFEYDACGRPVSRTDPLGRITWVEYDSLGRPAQLRNPDGSVIRAEHDAMGNVIAWTDALGQTTTMEYEGTGIPSRLTRADGHAWSMLYDGDERLIGIRNPGGETHLFEHDEAGRIVSERTFDGRSLEYDYSDEGHLSSISYPDGTWRLFSRDALGNVTMERTDSGEAQFGRDVRGRLIRAVLTERSGRSVVEVSRDEWGRITEERQGEHSISYRHDGEGRRIARSLSTGGETRYEWTSAGDLAGVSHDGRHFELRHDELGRESSRRARDGNFQIRHGYDVMDRLSDRQVMGNPAQGEISRRTWRYDLAGRLTESGDARWGTTLYEHDSIGQLVSARRAAYQEVFRYDPTGSLRNILDGSSADGVEPWETKPGNRLTRTKDASYEHDARGRRVKRIAHVASKDGAERAGDVTEYVWDAWDRLREVKKPGGERIVLHYDALGRRVRKEVFGGAGRRVVEFLWDGDVLAADIDSLQGQRTFVHEPGTFVPMLQAEQGEVFAVVNDHLGMPKELVDSEGRVAWSAAHSAWGRVVEEYRDAEARRAQPVESPFRLLGQYFDRETGLCHTKYRYFDAETGRWCSPDPLGIEGGANAFAFDGSPVNDRDPLGLCTEKGWSSRGNAGDASSNAQRARLREHLRQEEKYGAAGFKELENGRIRYYGDIDPATNPGEMAGRRVVREWDPKTGQKRTWHETVDQSGRVRIVRPQDDGPKVHQIFDHEGNYVGTR